MNSGDINAALFAQRQLSAQVLAAVESTNLTVAEEVNGIGKQFAGLTFEVFTVYNDNDRRTPDLIFAAQSKLSGKEKHGVGFAATCGSEVCATFAVAAIGAKM